QSFDDLLVRLRAALNAPGGTRLAGEVRRRYRAALIDEFQDTDPVQYRIFEALFAPPPRSSGPADPAPLLFLIGDPKQAIYAFRGADVFTYLDAARQANPSYTLETNRRSESALVRAVNTLFRRPKHPFVFDSIQFQPVRSASEADQRTLLEDG